MKDNLGEALLPFPDAGQGTSQHPVGQGFPGEVGVVSEPEFLGPAVDRGPWWGRVAEKAGAFLGSAAGVFFRYALDQFDQAIENEEEALREREFMAGLKFRRIEELWGMVRSEEIPVELRVAAFFDLVSETTMSREEQEGWVRSFGLKQNPSDAAVPLRGGAVA